jgi:DNA-binding beta-propeller fold protein YncE
MKAPTSRRDFIRSAIGTVACAAVAGPLARAAAAASGTRRYMYVAAPGIRDYLERGGHGILVFDIDNGHKFVKRIPGKGLSKAGKPLNVKGVVASAKTNRIWVSTLEYVTCTDLLTDKILWEKSYEGGCDRMALSPDGKIMYLPALEKDHWFVVDAPSGEIIKRLEVSPAGSHNTIYGPSGNFAYLAGLKSPSLRVAETKTHTIAKEVGPFGSAIRPFTINGSETLAYVNVNGLLGFEIGDLKTGKKLHRVEVQGFKVGVPKRHGCPSHGVALTNDEKEVWVCDGPNQRLHIFDNTVMPPKQVGSVELRDDPGWITMGLDGKTVYPSTGEVIDVKSRKIIASLTDETGAAVHSEKIVEVQFEGGKPARTGDQFGIGRVTKRS